MQVDNHALAVSLLESVYAITGRAGGADQWIPAESAGRLADVLTTQGIFLDRIRIFLN